MAESSRKRQKTFDGRAATLLKQTQQLATLCGSPACIVIYNPDDAIRPWRIWPDNEADFRNVIHTYKKTKKPKRQAAEKSRVSRGRKAATTVDDVGCSSPSSSSKSGVSISTTSSGGNGLRAPQSTCLAMDRTLSQATFDSTTVPPLQPPQAAAPSGQESVLAGMVEAWAGKEQALPANTTIADAAGIHSLIATANPFAHYASFDGLLCFDWGDTEKFELDTLLNSSDDQGMMLL